MLGQFGRYMPKEVLTRYTRGDAAESMNWALIHAGIIFRCTGQIATLYAPVMFFETPYSSMQHVVTNIHVNAAEHLQAKLHDCVRCYFAFKKMRWSGRLDVDFTHRIESLMFEIIAHWEPALEDIERVAQVNGRMAKYVVAAA